MISYRLFKLLVVIALFFWCGGAYAQVNLGDYDGDQLDDVSVVSVDSDAKTTSWVAINANTQKPVYTAAFSVPADALVAGRFYAESINTFPGVVYVRDAQRVSVVCSQAPWHSTVFNAMGVGWRYSYCPS